MSQAIPYADLSSHQPSQKHEPSSSAIEESYSFGPSVRELMQSQCMASFQTLERDPAMYLLDQSAYTPEIPERVARRYRTFFDFDANRERFAFRGICTDEAELEVVFSSGLRRSCGCYSMTSFAKDVNIAMGYSFRPFHRFIPDDQPAVAVLMQIEPKRLLTEGIQLEEEHTMRLIWDVRDEVSRHLLQRVLFFNPLTHKFVEI